MSYESSSSIALPSQNAYELELFRSRWIENVDKNFSNDFKSYTEPGRPRLTDSINKNDDREVAKIKAEFDRMEKRSAYHEKESRRREFFEYFPTKTCTSDQFIFVRNHTLVTSLNDIEILFDDGSILTDMSTSTMSHLRYSQMTDSCRTRLGQNLFFKMKRLFSCW